jgi:hypothetical protein
MVHGSVYRRVMHAARPRIALVFVVAVAGLVVVGALGAWTDTPRGAAGLANALTRQRAAAPASPQIPSGPMSASRATKLFTSPAGTPLGEVARGAIVQQLARERGWMRVRMEGWVQERDFSPADSSFASGLSAADLRANPDGTRGKVVRWEVQVLSLQVADPLRRDLGRDEQYLLAKGPGTENALLYLTIPLSLLAEAKTIAPLTSVIVTARVRTGRSEPVGTPILELISISRR